MLEASEKVSLYSSKFSSFDDFFNYNEQESYNACLNLLAAIGEEAKFLPDDLKQSFSHIDWVAVVSLRNHIAHKYRGIDPEIIWDIIENELPSLQSVVVKAVKYIANLSELKKFLDQNYYRNSRKHFE